MELGTQEVPSTPGVPAAAQAEPTITCEPIYLSLVIPAFNEAARLGRTLDAVFAQLAEKPYRSELVLVLDGCTDATADVAARYSPGRGQCSLRILDNPGNRGKGACVRQGMLEARGSYCVFTDADLSYPLYQLDRFLAVLVTEGGVAIASRDASVVHYQRPARRLVTVLSRWTMSHLFVPGIHDTQAGFKGFTREVARELFALQRLRGFGFDVELLHLAHLRRYPIHPLPIEWEDVPGSKVRLVRDVGRMVLELAALVGNRLLGRYRKRPEAR